MYKWGWSEYAAITVFLAKSALGLKGLSHIQQSYKNKPVQNLHDLMLTNISRFKYSEYKFDGIGLFSI